MREPIFVRPKEGVRVRKEDGSLILKEGCQVPDTRYYRKRIADGDLEIVEEKKTTAKKAGVKE